ncbi:MAG: metallophosphoesterase [Pirellulaceae bacterium]|nr:metallophosphoesterase [Pirellulaceae bacterium]
MRGDSSGPARRERADFRNAAAGTKQVATILHISDLHFGPPFVERVGEALLRIVPRLEPDVIVASGDFTQRAKVEQFELARQFLDRLPDVPLVVVPGNHDVPLYRIRERLFEPYRLYRQYIAPELDYKVELDGLVIVALNSTSPVRTIVNGRIDEEQLEYCSRAFADAHPEAAKIVVAHHHFAPAPDFVRDQVMPKAKRAMDRFVSLGVDVVLGGHLHRAYIGNSLDVYPGRDREHGVIIVQCGTTTSRRGRGREREKNTFNLLSVGPTTLRVTHFMYFDDLDGFAPLSSHLFPRPGHLIPHETRGPHEAQGPHETRGPQQAQGTGTTSGDSPPTAR